MSDQKSSPRKKDERTRHWTSVVYPDSAPDNWRDIINELYIQWVSSPLHDKDTDANGEIKKAHWHVLLMFDGKKSYEQIKEITDSINAPIPQKVASAKGLVRYMLHLDNPDKFQYEMADILAYGGADVAELLKPTASSRYQMIREMIAFIRDNKVTEFIDFADYAAEHRFDDWFPLLCDNSAFLIDKAIGSNRGRQDRKKDHG